MDRIENMLKRDCIIKIDKIINFKNICKVTNMEEFINLEIEYIPNEYVIEIQSYRDFFSDTIFNEYIEKLAEDFFNKINDLIKPKYLKLILFLIDDNLTPWSVTIETNKRK